MIHVRFSFVRILVESKLFSSSCTRPLFTVKTSTYHFCKMSLVKSPSLTQSSQPGSCFSTSDVEPQKIVIEENTESYAVNSTEGLKEHQQGTKPPFSPFYNGNSVRQLFVGPLLKIDLIIF
jgi:hypothetical protein